MRRLLIPSRLLLTLGPLAALLAGCPPLDIGGDDGHPSHPDFALGNDLAAPVDLALTDDLTTPPDLVTPPDLTPSPDLVANDPWVLSNCANWEIQPAMLDFGKVKVGMRVVKQEMVRWIGAGSATVFQVSLGGVNPADFTADTSAFFPTPFALAHGASGAVDVGFIPPGIGVRSATLRVVVTGCTIQIPMMGTGI